jgi:hypothetical protein
MPRLWTKVCQWWYTNGRQKRRNRYAQEWRSVENLRTGLRSGREDRG